MTERSEKMLSELAPHAQPVFRKFLEMLDKKLGDDRYIVFEGRRYLSVQEAYYAQGRKSLTEVNELRKKAGLYLLGSERDNYVITWTMDSKHLAGTAMDVLPMTADGNPTWDLAHYRQFFEKIRDCGHDAGLVCGGYWSAPKTDWPHYELG